MICIRAFPPAKTYRATPDPPPLFAAIGPIGIAFEKDLDTPPPDGDKAGQAPPEDNETVATRRARVQFMVPGSAAEKLGTLRPGDVLLSINGEDATYANVQEQVPQASRPMTLRLARRGPMGSEEKSEEKGRRKGGNLATADRESQKSGVGVPG